MTEQQWLSSTSPAEMLAFLRKPQYDTVGKIKGGVFAGGILQVAKPSIASEWKMRLFADACADFCDCKGIRNTNWKAYVMNPNFGWDLDCKATPVAPLLLRLLFGNPFRRVELPRTKIERAEKNPNGPGGTIYLSCPWQTTDVLSVAQTAYETHDATLFGPFWDALETAGCDNEEIENALKWRQRCPKCLGTGKHYEVIRGESGTSIYFNCDNCNGTGWLPIPGEPFMVRGFWPVDLMLGKS